MEWLKQNWISLIGTLVSIGSAIFALFQARNAKLEKKEAAKEKNEVIKVKEEIIKKWTNYNDSQLRTKIETTLRNLNKTRNTKDIDELKIGKDEYGEVTELLIFIRGQKIFEESEVKQNVENCEQITQKNEFNRESISKLIRHLADIQRFIDKSIRG